MTKKDSPTGTAPRELINLERLFDAPLPLVWEVWTRFEHLKHWFSPKPWTLPEFNASDKTGAKIRMVMRSPDGKDSHAFIGKYEEVVPFKKIVWTGGFEGLSGQDQMLTTVLFDEKDGKTRVRASQVMNYVNEATKPMMDGAPIGWGMTMDQLGEHLATFFTVSRLLEAPRELVFKVQTDPEHLKKWFEPGGAKMLKAEMDLRPGGTYHYGYRNPDGSETWGKQSYLEIKAPEKLVFLQSFSDANGGLTRHPMAPTWPLQMLASTFFQDLGDKTLMTIAWMPYEADADAIKTFEAGRGSMTGGFKMMLDTLETYLKQLHAFPSDREMLTSREFNFPVEAVFDAWTKPESIAQWWGPTGFRNEIEKFEFKPGGEWKFVMRAPDGTGFPNHSFFREIDRPRRIVLEHEAPHFVLTASFEELGIGRSRMTWRAQFDSKASLDAVKSFAVPGNHQNFVRLEAWLEKNSRR
jgi:uncharacterized protein YndB with AHSA1/START domain